VSTFATSAPLPPVSPPPAVGCGVSGFGVAFVGAAGGVTALTFGAGLGFAFGGAGVGRVGVTLAGVGGTGFSTGG
jgi:hypothetical protein